ncbi:MAG TPA: amidohydrolase family protein, partial [Puia sp.]|nr:amidohydrolase family protein [Puia sp.]
EKLISWEEAIHKMSGLAAQQLHLNKRGTLKVGNYADVIVFDPKMIGATSTYEKPHQLAVGMTDVFVNGVQVLRDREHTGAKPGRAVFGMGKK